MYSPHLKRLFDLLVATILFLVLLPLVLVVTLGLAIANRGQPFFFQTRPGKDERLFRIIKFKTMNDQKDANGNLLPDADRLTPWGRIVRKTSLDEIPQLINVIKGDMSLIGPRPLLVQYLPLYNETQKQRHHIRPGITGWAQVNGRNTLSWEDKFEYDVWYVQNCSFTLDMKILWLTLVKVFRSEGISQAGQATMQPFRGSAKPAKP